MIVKQLKPHEYSEERRKALKEAARLKAQLDLIGSEQKSLNVL